MLSTGLSSKLGDIIMQLSLYVSCYYTSLFMNLYTSGDHMIGRTNHELKSKLPQHMTIEAATTSLAWYSTNWTAIKALGGKVGYDEGTKVAKLKRDSN